MTAAKKNARTKLKHRFLPERYTAGWIDEMDNRFALARGIRERFHAVAADLGGLDNLSYQQRSLIERALFLEANIAMHERALIEGEEFDANKWVASLNALVGLWRLLGIERQQRTVSLRDLTP